MDLLLDTHAFLWFITGDKQLSDNALTKIKNPDKKCFISIASIWEIVIKYSLDKLEIKGGFQTVENFLENNDIELLPINLNHTKNLLKLEQHHRDPFDSQRNPLKLFDFPVFRIPFSKIRKLQKEQNFKYVRNYRK